MPNTTINYYQEKANKIVKEYEKVDISVLQKKLKKSFVAGSKLLELGSGSGRDAASLLVDGFDILISDASEKMLLQAIAIHPNLKGRAFRIVLPFLLPFKNDSFDGVFAIAVLMHLTNNELNLTLNEINRLLKKGGRLFFSISLERKGLAANGKDKNGRFFNLLPEREWIRICESKGFNLINKETNNDEMGRKGFVWGNFLFEKNEKINQH